MTGRVPLLDAGGLCFRPWRDSDAGAVLVLARDPEAWRWMRTLRGVRDRATALDWVRARHDDDRVDWAVCDPVTGSLVGRVGLHHFSAGRSAEIGYAVWPGHRGKGVAVLMVTTAVGHAFGAMRLTRVALTHATGNPASCSVATRCGFASEGLERAAFDHGDGVLHDLHRHARLATDPPGPAPPPPGPLEPVAVPAPGRGMGIDHVEIAAGRLQLRPPQPQDAEDTLLLLTDTDVARWNPGPGRLDLAGVRDWCRRAADWQDGSHATFSVLDATTGRLLGSVSLHKIDRTAGDAEIGYRVAPWARGRGVATDSVVAAARWAFGALGLVRVELGHAVANPASCRVAEKAGFALEGTLRQAYVYGDGRRYDEHLHARLSTDENA